MNTDRLRRGAAVAFAAIVAASTTLTGNAPGPAKAADLTATSTPAESLRILGGDGRFTILLLGSDARWGITGRTDAMLVASVDPVTGKAAILSIPRDTAYFPMAPVRAGKFPGKINALYPYLARTYKTPGYQLRRIIGRAFGIEIDAYAIVTFGGFRKLVNNVGGLDVYVSRKVCDYSYWMTARKRGVCFNAGWNRQLKDLRALAFARIRHTPGGDYARAGRQQQLIVAATKKVRDRGEALVPNLLAVSTGLRKTDLPLALTPLIYQIVSRANVGQAPRVVFKPSTYAYSISGYRNILKMAACKAWIRRYFPPVHWGNAWLPPEPTPTPTPIPTPTPEPTPVGP
jgi:LCP family protein required for cell wall assembly